MIILSSTSLMNMDMRWISITSRTLKSFLIKKTVLQCWVQMRMKSSSSSLKLTCRQGERSLVVIIAAGFIDAGVDAVVTKVNAGETAIKNMEVKSKNAPQRTAQSHVLLLAQMLTSATENAAFFGIQRILAIVTRDVVSRKNEEMQGIIEAYEVQSTSYLMPLSRIEFSNLYIKQTKNKVLHRIRETLI